jgi:hypothetical protein
VLTKKSSAARRKVARPRVDEEEEASNEATALVLAPPSPTRPAPIPAEESILELARRTKRENDATLFFWRARNRGE